MGCDGLVRRGCGLFLIVFGMGFPQMQTAVLSAAPTGRSAETPARAFPHIPQGRLQASAKR